MWRGSGELLFGAVNVFKAGEMAQQLGVLAGLAEAAAQFSAPIFGASQLPAAQAPWVSTISGLCGHLHTRDTHTYIHTCAINS